MTISEINARYYASIKDVCHDERRAWYREYKLEWRKKNKDKVKASNDKYYKTRP